MFLRKEFNSTGILEDLKTAVVSLMQNENGHVGLYTILI